jgi:fatty-acyl-CoA synthase
MTHPAIREAMVVGIPHEKWQERPVAIVVARGDRPEEDDLRTYLSERFAKWWLPDRFVWVEELPKTSMGKLDKKRARAELEEPIPSAEIFPTTTPS